MGKRFGKTAARIASGAPPSDYLMPGETLRWKGKPAAIVILGRGLLLTFFALVYFSVMMVYVENDGYLPALGIVVLICIMMALVERRFGLLGGVAGIGIAVWAFLSDKGLEWYWYLVPLIFALVALLINYIYLNRVMFVITDRRIITRYGIFTLRYADTGVDKIQNVTVIQPWYERVFGYGDIYFATAGEKGGIDYESPGIKLRSGGAVEWENVGRPFEVNKIAAAVINPSAMPVVVVDQPVQRPSALGTEERLRELDDLRQKGLVTQQEYDEKRKQILERL
ncbi:MAG: PH domain-containing protein [Methanomassiliicoccales archaeon]|nr:MAG: PH domain-containing protein [Methanomassiliicoccales archaeon]